MIDVHTHLLPGVDDGSRTIAESLPVLERFARHGVTTVVCTPHLNASEAARAPYARHAEILAELKAAAPASPELVLGWEIMLDAPGADLREPTLGLASSTARLVEFPRTAVPPNSAEEIFRLRTSGIVPVLAHPERYWGCTVAQVREWRRAGAVIQMDAAALASGKRPAGLALEMIEQGLVDVIASDTHGDRRAMAPARAWLEEIGAGEQAELMTRVNPAHLLANEPVVPVAPIAARKGMIGRLKQMLLGS